MNSRQALMIPATTPANETIADDSTKALFKDFTIAIVALIAVSAVVQLVLHWVVPGM